MNIDEFFESAIYKNSDFKVQELLQDLIEKLGNMNYVIIERNEPVLVLKVRGMYENNPRSQANIATIRLKKGYITIGPYKSKDENIVRCICKADISDKLIDDIRSIYIEKL
ncbi:hypothetical protein [Clostridium tagluense]|uniref:hypothetical protein n=1 Tax=Clostridium tagluense TaxID=360422 RepID=UPI001CF5AE28|nr:hypothetical protein [Clostridium tagluense]MCB2299889.1 hypothetical protein [Clostridium tagluense]